MMQNNTLGQKKENYRVVQINSTKLDLGGQNSKHSDHGLNLFLIKKKLKEFNEIPIPDHWSQF